LFVLPVACGGAGSTEICKQAAERYIACTEEIMGKEFADLARSKTGGVEACAESQRTVDWYNNKCLPKKDCKAFMDCTLELAMQEP
jgi:hypothetical protein